MRVVCVSDTHTMGNEIVVPDGDLLLHAGDHTFRGTERETKQAMKWLESLPHKYKVAVPGNHDFYFDLRYPHGHTYRTWRITRYFKPKELMEHYAPSVRMLIDESVEIEGLKIYGSPWQPWYWDWAFNLPANVELINKYAEPNVWHDYKAAAEVWAKIPADTNILVTHSPPYGIMDAIGSKMHGDDPRTGCPELRRRLNELKKLRLHVFGHIHEGYGRKDWEMLDLDTKETGILTLVNASINTREYRPTNPPIVVDI